MTLIRPRTLATALPLSLLLVSVALSPTACKSSGGADGTGGAAGGSKGTGGSVTGSGGASSGTGGSVTTGSATFSVTITPSSAVATVEIVTWSVNVSIDSAVIDFGRDQSNFEFQAPVDLTQANYRTLLLGMKPNTTYYVRITAQGGGKSYVSPVSMVKSGFLPNGLPVFTVTDSNASALYAGGGFTVNCIGLAGSAGLPGQTGKSVAFILDKDGTLVWALDITSTPATNCSRARMSYDGQYMFAGNFANSSTGGAIFRIGMDGVGSGQTWTLPGRSHDFAILPNGNVLYFKTDNGGTNVTPGPEEVMELNTSTGASTTIYDEGTDFASLISSTTNPESHTNHVTYSPDLSAVTFSMFFTNTIGVASYPSGKLLMTIGGTQSTFPNMTWSGQHGHDLHADHVWIFNNAQSSAHILGYSFSTSAKTATLTLDYNPGIACNTFGDVKELPNGNLYVTFSDTGVFHEITKTGTLLRAITTTTAIGYSEHRWSLYGPPPPFSTN
jgi:hypothetical protein